MRSFKQDYKNGKENEERLFNYMENNIQNFDGYLEKNKFECYDIVDTKNKYFIEVKQRQYNKGCFKDWLIGYDKIEKYELIKELHPQFKKYKYMFINSFVDGDYFVIIDNLNDTDYSLSNFQRTERIDKNDIRKKYMFINDNCFKPIHKYKKRIFKKKKNILDFIKHK